MFGSVSLSLPNTGMYCRLKQCLGGYSGILAFTGRSQLSFVY